MGRPRKGPTVRRQHACPCCNRWLSGRAALHDRAVAYREVEYAGRGQIRVVATKYADELERGELLAELRLAVAKLAANFGLHAEHEVVREVIRTVIKYRIPPAFKARAAEWQAAAAKWARHVKSRERAQYDAPAVRHEGRQRAAWFSPSVEAAPAARYEGRKKATWGT